MRLKLVPESTKVDFFKLTKITFGASVFAMILSVFLFFFNGLNLGIDFLGGTTIRTDSQQSVDVSAYRAALDALELGDVTVTEIFDITKPELNAAQIRFEAQSGEEAATVEVVSAVKLALMSIDKTITFPQVESVGPEVSGELVKSAITAILAAIVAVLFYIWLRFEWQFSVGAIAALVHDIVVTIGIFSYTTQNLVGSVLLMISHGIVSGALFLCIGLLYERHHTRIIKYFAGLLATTPIFSSFFTLFSMANIGLPGTSSFIGEFLIIAGCFFTNTLAALFSALGMILGGGYSL